MLMIPPLDGGAFTGNSSGKEYASFDGSSVEVEHADLRQAYSHGWSPATDPVAAPAEPVHEEPVPQESPTEEPAVDEKPDLDNAAVEGE